MKYSDFLQIKRDCPFDTPPVDEVLMENKNAYLTIALAPYHKDHLMVVPKRHIIQLLDVTEEEQKDIDALENHAWEILKKLGYTSVSYIVREGNGSGRTVDHVHYHVIPEVRLGDIDHNGDARAILSPEEAKAEVERLKKVV